MTLPILLFQGATHGNFLTRCCHVASGEIEDFDFYGSNYGAHRSIGSKRIIDHHHPHDLSLSDENNIFVYISIDHSDLYILLWHWMLASGEFGLDLLTIKDFADIEKVLNKKTKNAQTIKNNIKKQVDIFKNDHIRGMREFFKNLIKVTEKTFFECQEDILNRQSVENIFKFAWFYDQEVFCKQVEKLLIKLGYTYKIDIAHHQQTFLDRKQNAIQSRKLVELAFQCYTSNTNMDISNFCLYEQSYLDFLIEQHLGYEIEISQEYPTNTQDLNPTKVWEGVRYEL